MNKTDCKGCKLMVNCEWSYGSKRPPCSNLQVGSQESLSQVERASKLLKLLEYSKPLTEEELRGIPKDGCVMDEESIEWKGRPCW